MRVIDSHVHFPEDRIIDEGLPAAHLAQGNEKGSGYTSGRKPSDGVAHDRAAAWLQGEKARWESAWRFPTAEAVSPEEGEKRWAAEIDAYECLKAVVFVTSGSNEFMGKLVSRHPERFIGYAHHNPELHDAADRLERAVKTLGLRGYKILAPKVNKPISDPCFDPIWEVAQATGIPVLIHFGIMGAAGGIASHINMNPIAIHDAAKRFPRLSFIVPHFGTGYVFELLNLCWACPNVFVDTSGSNQWVRWMPYEVTLESLFRKFRETVGASRIVFGTDSSWFPRGFTRQYLDAQVRAMSDVGYSEDEKDQVLYRNIAELVRFDPAKDGL
jgi:predicted TIM-barrel fold metal-dependent hydrolase